MKDIARQPGLLQSGKPRLEVIILLCSRMYVYSRPSLEDSASVDLNIHGGQAHSWRTTEDLWDMTIRVFLSLERSGHIWEVL